MASFPTTVLITGGNGNLGRLLAKQLLARGQTVIKFDIPGSEPAITEPGETIVTGDIRDTDTLRELIETHQPGVIYHLASLLSGSSEADLEASWEINASASFRLLKLAVDCGVPRVFFASTAATYSSVDANPMPNDYPQWPRSFYGATKVAVERAGVYFKLKHGLDFRCLRFPLVLSPFAPKTAVSAFPSHAFRAAKNDEPFVFPITPDTGISTLFLDDVITSIVDYVDAEPSRLSEHAYNVHSFYLDAQMVADAVTRRFPNFQYRTEIDTNTQQLISDWPDVIDDSAARADWGWSPVYDFDQSCEGLLAMLEGEETVPG